MIARAFVKGGEEVSGRRKVWETGDKFRFCNLNDVEYCYCFSV